MTKSWSKSVTSWKGTGPLHAVNGTVPKEVLHKLIFPKMKEWFQKTLAFSCRTELHVIETAQI
jgi:hypothetical protein